MRFLCLHGKGTSAAILESQTAQFRCFLPPSYSGTEHAFDFIDAPLLSDPAPPVDHFYAGPFYSWYALPLTSELENAHEWLSNLIQEKGPYDGVLGFSQGCALAATFLLRLQRDEIGQASIRGRPPQQPFKFAVFICGGLPLYYLADQGYDISEAARIHDKESGQALQSQASYAALVEHGDKRWNYIDRGKIGHSDPAPDTSSSEMPLAATFATAREVCGLDCAQILPEHMIQIPTVHIYGSRDPRMASAFQLARFCREDVKRIFDHGGGHDLPRTTVVSQKIAGLVSWAMDRVRQSAENGGIPI
ncbi:serine hydrolase FSH [Delphinella strobiligena]|nr:serine hydrolase FSH [Delphinella strobiligena]